MRASVRCGRGRAIIGAAVTVWCHAGDNVMYHKALSLAQPGDVLVINTQGSGNAGFGELLATSAMKIGVRAVIVDGMVRDAEALGSDAAAGVGARPLAQRLQ